MESEERLLDEQNAPAVGPDNPPWNSLEAMAVWIVSVLLILIIPTILLLPYLATLDRPVTEPNDLVEFAKSNPTAIILQILGIIPAHILTILVAWAVVTRVRKHGFLSTLGWQKGGFRWWHYAALLVGFFAIAALVGHYFPEQEHDLIRILKSSRNAVYAVAFLATFTAPFVEEVVYRGVLYSAFQRSFGVNAALVLVTLLFALVHVPQYWPSYSTIFLLTLLSITLAWVRVRTGNLLPCVILHTIFNGLQSALLIAEPYLKPETVPDPAGSVVRLIWPG
jgi:uncharacterized protein